jgi:hypothetical protein
MNAGFGETAARRAGWPGGHLGQSGSLPTRVLHSLLEWSRVVITR